MNRKVFAGIFAIALLAGGFLAGRMFGIKEGQKKQPKILGAATGSQPIKIGLIPWIGDGLFYVAKDKGFFAQENVNVEFVNFDDFATGKQLLQSGRIDALYLTPETAAVLADAGVKIKIVAANDLSVGADGIVAAKNIQNIEDLKGKQVAFEIGSTSHFLLSFLLNQKGLSTNDLNVVEEIAPDAGAAFVAGKVDAAVTWEPWLSKAGERTGGHLLVSSQSVPIIYDMPIFRAEVVDQRGQDVKALFRALFSAQAWITQHAADETAAVIAKPLNITPQEAKAQMQGVRWLSYQENLDKLSSGDYSVKYSIQTAENLWLKLGLIKNKLSADQLVDDSLLKNLYQ